MMSQLQRSNDECKVESAEQVPMPLIESLVSGEHFSNTLFISRFGVLCFELYKLKKFKISYLNEEILTGFLEFCKIKTGYAGF